MRGEFIVVRGVENNSLKAVPLPESHKSRKIDAVFLLLNEADFTSRGGEAVHHANAFMDDRLHDWQQRGDALHYYAHSSAKGDVVDIVVYFEPLKE